MSCHSRIRGQDTPAESPTTTLPATFNSRSISSSSPKPFKTIRQPYRARSVAMPRPMTRLETVTRAIPPLSMVYPPSFPVDVSSVDAVVFAGVPEAASLKIDPLAEKCQITVLP